MFIGKFIIFSGLAKQALHHAHFSIEVVDFGDEDRLGRGGDNGCAPLELTLMT